MSENEVSPDYPSKNPQTREAVGILEENVEFRWDHPQDHWGGLNRNQLIVLVGQIGEMLNFRINQTEMIRVFFGDHIIIEKRDGSEHINTGCCLVDFDKNEQLKNCRVILNRSREIADHATSQAQKKREKVKTKEIKCVFQSPKENIIWLLTEELSHAQIWLKAGTKGKEAQWQLRYKRILKKKGREFDDYSEDLQEVTVSRRALRILSKLAPERSEYFDELYEESFGKVIDQTYIKTGFNIEQESK